MTTQINDSIETTPESRGPRTPWVLLLPLALFAGGIWQKTRAPETPLDTGNMTGNIAENAIGNSATAHRNAVKDRAAEVSYSIYVPDDNGKLHLRTIKEKGIVEAGNTIHRSPNRALELLFQNAPELFPAGTKLTNGGVERPPGEKGPVWQVSLNKEFQASEQWRSETITQVALGAIALTTQANLGNLSYDPQIKLLIAGKAISNLGEYDLSDPVPAGEFKSLVSKD